VEGLARSVLAACGLAEEARIAAAFSDRIVTSGADPERLARRLGELDLGRHRFAVSFGLCGGLGPGLVAGTMIIPDTVFAGRERFTADLRLSDALRAALPGAIGGILAGVDRALVDPAEKARCASEMGASAADMESHVLARAAVAAGIPFVVLRAVSDAADRVLPPLALSAIDSEGNLSPARILSSLWRRPSQIALLPALARDSRRAFASLKAAAPVAADLFSAAA
jgi:hopanoid-associated phosphorylase